MKNAILVFTIALLLLNGAASAQIFTQNGKDSAAGQYIAGSELTVPNGIRSGSSNVVVLKWNIIASQTTFGPGWNMIGSGVCDNNLCYTALSSNNLFNNNATQPNSNAYDNSAFPSSVIGTLHDFHVVFSTSNPANGTSAVVRVNALDTVSGTSRTLTFIGYKSSTGISTINSSDNVILYPNPAREALNVIYDESAGVRTIAVYNLIGKLMGPIYRPSSSASAKIDLGDMPTGIYFLRLMDGQGHVLATRRFTRQ